MPPDKTRGQLVEEFANYFIEETEKIRKDLKHYPIYEWLPGLITLGRL